MSYFYAQKSPDIEALSETRIKEVTTSFRNKEQNVFGTFYWQSIRNMYFSDSRNIPCVLVYWCT